MSHIIEQKWIEYWNDLHDLIKTLNNPKLINAEFEILSLENAQQLIQDEVYKGNDIEFEVVDYQGSKAIMIKN
jgi:hypothetical protein